MQATGGTNPPAINLPGHFEAEDYNPGGEGVGYHDTSPGNTGGAYRQDDVDIQTCSDPTTPSGQTCYNVGWIATGEWLAYTVDIASAGNYTFAIRVATPQTGAQMHIEIDKNDVSGPITVPNTGGWQIWQTITTTGIPLPAGRHELRLVTDVSSYNLNYVDVTAGTVSAPAAPSNVQASAVSSGEVDLTWTDNANNEANYVVERQQSGSSTWTVLDDHLPADTNQYQDTTVSPSTTYTYRVKATNSGGDSSYATSNSVSTPGATVINLPGHFEAEDYNPGGEGVGYHDTTSGNTGGAYRNDDVDIQTCTDPTTPSGQTCYNVGWIASGEWLAYDVNIASAGDYTLAIRVATPYANRQMHVALDGTDVSGTINVPNTGDFQNWQTVTTGPISLPAGTHQVRLVFDTASINVNYVDVAAAVTPPTTNLPGRVEAENYNPGGEGVGYHDTTPGNTGGAYRQNDVDIQTCTDPTTPSGSTCYNVGWVASGEWLAYDVSVSTTGNFTFSVRVATPYANRQMHVEVDGNNISGTINVPNTGGFQNWQTVSAGTVSLSSGTHHVRLVFDTSSINIDYFEASAS